VNVPAAVLALHCMAAAPAPAVDAPVMAALRGESVPSAKADVAAALLAIRKRGPRR